jgi:hypothetical protein
MTSTQIADSSPAEDLSKHETLDEALTASRAASGTKPLLHIPIYVPEGGNHYLVEYMVELACAGLDSYFSHGNDCELLVTSNDPRPLDFLSRYRRGSGHTFYLQHVSKQDLLSTFRVDPRHLSDAPCTKMLFSKCYPLLKRFHTRIVHIDFDTIFMKKIDFRHLFTSGIGLVRCFASRRTRVARRLFGLGSRIPRFRDCALRFEGLRGGWFPTPTEVAFFRMKPEKLRPRTYWLNSGIFSVQGDGFNLVEDEVNQYLARLDDANAAGLNGFPDELIMNALAIREPARVGLLDDYTYNFLAYQLFNDKHWTRTAKILHFHSLKPNLFRTAKPNESPRPPTEHRGQEYRISNDLYLAESASQGMPSVRGNLDFHLAGMKWFLHLHAASRALRHPFPMLEAVPQAVAIKEHARLLTELGYKRR